MRGNSPTLSLWTLVLNSLRYFWRTHTAVGLGVAAATAVIVGALVVGDSVRGSLRGLVLNRLANIECLLHSRTFFEPELLSSLSLPDGTTTLSLAPAIILSSSTVENTSGAQLLRAAQVQVLAVDDAFLTHLDGGQAALFPGSLQADQVALNATLADELSVKVGDEITLRVSQTSGVPADNPLGRRDATSISLPRQQVVAILPDEGIGGVSFMSGQAVPRNVFASLSTVQDILECGSQSNAILVFSDNPSQTASETGQSLCDALNFQLHPSLEDYGLQFEHHRRLFPDPQVDASAETSGAEAAPPQVVYDYYQLSSEELILDDATSDAVMTQLGETRATRLLTYLANSIAKVEPTARDLSAARRVANFEPRNSDSRAAYRNLGTSVVSVGPMGPSDGPPANAPPKLLSREVPYSIVVGVGAPSDLQLEQAVSLDRDELRAPYCWINTWLAEQLEAQPGDWIRLSYYLPETVDGREVEEAWNFQIAGIVPVTEPTRAYRRRDPAQFSAAPTIYNDPNLTPNVPGVTDQDSISNWDLPFKLELEDKILPVDDAYWGNHRLTPKVFTPYRYASSSQLFGSRFGDTTAIRIPAAEVEDEAALRAEIEEALLSTRPTKGLTFLPVRSQQLQAAAGTTPFDMLFLSLSFFVIVAALLLVSLLFKLGVQQRTSQLGMLLAQGFSQARVRQALLRELSLVAGGGAMVGILLGLGYARLMIAGLESWWLGAISSPFLRFTFQWQSLLIGAVAGMFMSLATIYTSLRKLSHLAPLAMLRGDSGDSFRIHRKLNRFSLALAGFVALAAIGLILLGIGQTGMARAGSFFGSGMLLLGAALIALRQWIEAGPMQHGRPERSNLWQLAWRAICRNPVRSSLSLGLLAVASFLIASMGVFRVSPSERGYGGFDLLGESSQPIYRNIASASIRNEILGDAAKQLSNTAIIPLRARRGEDASCNNLFQVAQPSVLGVPPQLQEFYDLSSNTSGFEWAASNGTDRPWDALAKPAVGTPRNPIPVVLDQNTAAWSLKQGASLDAIIKLQFDEQTIYFQTVGLLSNSVLQGKLLISQENFEQLFPKISGYSFFLIQSGSSQSQETVAATLEQGWSDVGLDVTRSETVLARLLGVQNTYISAFQSLGALGLLLGTFGLVAVQVRSVVERRRELALMQAVGFSNVRIARMLSLETAILLGGGLVVGVLCAAIALVPYIIEVDPQMSVINPLVMLLAVLVVGFVAAGLAVRTATHQSLLANLRAE